MLEIYSMKAVFIKNKLDTDTAQRNITHRNVSR